MSATGRLFEAAVELLKQLIATPSVSGEEDRTAGIIEAFLKEKGKSPCRKLNNIWCVSDNSHENAPVILLNSHHDTVKASGKWSHDPCQPVVQGDYLYGLGSNDAGASVVSLLAAYLHLSSQPGLPYNLIIAITAEEETSGANGITCIMEELGRIDLAVVGEPSEMQMAVAEKGLVVLDCVAEGKAGHAARDEGINAIYAALPDIEFIRKHHFPRSSDLLGPVKMTVTQINSGHQHNVVPARCEFVVDIRTNEHYSNREIVSYLQQHLQSRVEPRSVRLNSSNIPLDHPIVKRGVEMGLKHYGSPTLSDQALMDFTSIKIGPGKSSRSHTADEFILLSEIEQGIDTYIKLLTDLQI